MGLKYQSADLRYYLAPWRKAEGYQRHCFNICGLAQHAVDTPRGADRAQIFVNEIVALQN